MTTTTLDPPTKVLQRETKELVGWFVRGVDENEELLELTEAPQAAFATGADRPEDWENASWVDGGPFDSPIGSAWRAEIEIGGEGSTADVELAPGMWRMYSKTSFGDEAAVILVGYLRIE